VRGVAEADGVGATIGDQIELDRAAALDLAAARIEAKLVGDGLTVAQLLDAIPGLTDEERAAVATRPSALVSRLNPGAQRKLARELRALR
jgi:hypothetical protein